MEENMFPQVEGILEKYVRVSLYLDDRKHAERSRRYQKLQVEKYGTPAIPFYAILTPEGETIDTFAGYTTNKAEFEAFVKKGVDNPRQKPVVADSN